jgi:hypothetical protein
LNASLSTFLVAVAFISKATDTEVAHLVSK